MFKRTIAKLLVFAMLLSVAPTVAFADNSEYEDEAAVQAQGEVLYYEDFESDTAENEVKNKFGGWGWDGEDDTIRNATDIWVGDNGGGSDSLRFATGDSWYKTNWLTLDADAALEAYGSDPSALSEDVTISFNAKFEVQGLDEQNLPEHYIRIKGQYQQPVAEISIIDGKLRLIALNDDGTENVAYEIKDVDTTSQTTEWHSFEFRFDMSENKFAVVIDGELVTAISEDGWAPVSNKAGTGAITEEIPAIGVIDSIEFGNWFAGWWQCIYLDDLRFTSGTQAPAIPTAAPTIEPTAQPEEPTTAPGEPTAEPTEPTSEPVEPTAEPTAVPEPTADVSEYFFYEDFESDTIQDEITQKLNGWGWDKPSEVTQDPFIRVSDNEREGFTDTLLFSNGDSWYRNMWMTFDPKAAYLAKSPENTEEEADDVLTSDLTLSFRAMFEIQGTDGAGGNEIYIRVKGQNDQVIAELSELDGKLYLIALDESMSQNVQYYIKDVDVSQRTVDAQDIEIDLNFETNSYRLRINGETFSNTPFGEWVPAGSQSGLQASEHQAIGRFKSIEFGHFWSGWFQCLYLDNLAIKPVEGGFPEDPDATPKPTATPLPDSVKYIEDFEDGNAYESVQDNTNGWSYTYEQGQGSSVNITNSTGRSGGSGLGLSSSDWYKTMSVSLDMLENGIVKKVESGSTQDAAEAEVRNYLSTDEKLSFDFRFTISDISGTNVQYFRINTEDGNGIIYVYQENTTSGTFLKMYALNEQKTAVTTYTIAELGSGTAAQTWHKAEIYFNHEKNAYMLVLDGEIFNDTPHGKWIPIPSTIDRGAASAIELGTVKDLIFGHSYTGWDQGITIDNIMIEDYEPIEEIFEVREIVITDEGGSETVTPGDTVTAKIYVDGGTANPNRTVETWSYSTDGGATWIPLEGRVLPDDATNVRVEVTCVSTDGVTASNSAEKEVVDTTELTYADLFSESFDGSGMESSINNQRNGWSITGSGSQTNVGSFNSERAVRFASLNSGGSSSLTLDLSRQGYDVNIPKTYLKFDFSFGVSGENENPESGAIYYFNVCDTSGNVMASLTLIGDEMFFVYFDENDGVNKSYSLAKGRDEVIDVWRTAEFYFDSESNHYSLFIDGEPIGPDNGKWIQASTNGIIGQGAANDFDGVGSLVIGFENAAWWGTVMLSGIDVKSYEFPTADSAKFSISNAAIVNAFDPGAAVANQSEVAADIDAVGYELASQSVNWSYRTSGGSEWLPMSGNTVPANASDVKADISAVSVYGEEATAETETEVVYNTAPVITDLTISGDFEEGSTLTAEYTFSDLTDGENNDRTTFEWYRTDNINNEFQRIEGASGREYAITADDLDGFIKVVATPTDMYGAKGEAVEAMRAYSSGNEAQAALDLISIDTAPGNSVTNLNLPTEDEYFGIDISWSSSNPSIISSDGTINRPDYGSYVVTLTATARTEDGVTATKTFRVTITGRYGSSSGGSGGSSGGSGGGSYGGSWSGSTSGSATGVGQIGNPAVEDPQNVENEVIFADVASDAWYNYYVYELYNAGIVSKDEYFRPEDPVTRAEFVKMIVEMLGIRDSSAVVSYTDLSETDWSYVYIASATKFGIIQGNGDGTFGVNDNITREDMAVIIDRAVKLVGYDVQTGEPSFNDNDQISDYAYESVGCMQANGIIQGYEGNFSPKDTATRAEAAKVVAMVMALK